MFVDASATLPIPTPGAWFLILNGGPADAPILAPGVGFYPQFVMTVAYPSMTITPRGGAIGAATTSAVSEATENNAEGGNDGEEFRFSLTPQRIKLGMGNMVGAYTSGKSTQHSRTLAALEKALGAAKGMQ